MLETDAGQIFGPGPRKAMKTPAAGVLSLPVRWPPCGLDCLRWCTSDSSGAAVAQKIQVLLIDDLDGSEAEGTVRFGLDGTEYELDLNAEHARALREALARYVSMSPGGEKTRTTAGEL